MGDPEGPHSTHLGSQLEVLQNVRGISFQAELSDESDQQRVLVVREQRLRLLVQRAHQVQDERILRRHGS